MGARGHMNLVSWGLGTRMRGSPVEKLGAAGGVY